MKKQTKKVLYLVFLLAICISLAACSNKDVHEDTSSERESQSGESSEKKENIKIACVDESEPIVIWIKEALEPLGYDVEAVLFSANQLPATALKDGDVDGLIANQLFWVETFNKENNCNLHMVEPYIYYDPTKVFSSKYNSLDELPQNAQIAIPGDPSNMERALLGLEKAGLITFGEKTGNFYSLLDIKDNPKNIEFIETERGTTARIINDVDAIICGSTEAKKTGIDIEKFLYNDFKKYPHGLIVNSKDVDLDWVKEAIKISTSEEFKENFNNYYEGSYVLID